MKKKLRKKVMYIMALIIAISSFSESKEAGTEFIILGTYFKSHFKKSDKKEIVNNNSEDNSGENIVPDDNPDIIPDPVPVPVPDPEPEPEPEPVVKDPFPVVKEDNIIKAEKTDSGEILQYYVSDNISASGHEALWMTDENTKVYNNKTLDTNYGNIVVVENKAYFENNGTILGKMAGVKLSGASTMVNNSLISNFGNKGVEVLEGSAFTNNGVIENKLNYGIYVSGDESVGINGTTGIINNRGAYGLGVFRNGTGYNYGSIENGSYGLYVLHDGTGYNYGSIKNGKYGMYLYDNSTGYNYGVIENNGTYGLTVDKDSYGVNETGGLIKNNGNVGIYTYDGGTAYNYGRVENNGSEGFIIDKNSYGENGTTGVISNFGDYGMKIMNSSYGVNNGVIENTGNTGLYISNSSQGINNGTISLTGDNKTGVYVDNSEFVNNGNIIMNGENNTAIKAVNNSKVTIASGSVITLTNGVITDTADYSATDFSGNGAGNTSTLGKFYDLDSTSVLVNSGLITGNLLSIQNTGKFILDSNTGKIEADTLNLNGDMYISPDITLDSSNDKYSSDSLFVNAIDGDGKVISDSKLFSASLEKTSDSYTVTLERKNFQDVFSGDLGAVLEYNYSGSENNPLKNKVYNSLKQINNDDQLKTADNELTSATQVGNQVYQQFMQDKMINNGIYSLLDKRNENRDGIYVNFLGGRSDIHDYNNINGYDGVLSGVLVGGMKQIGENTSVGGFAGYIDSEYNYNDSSDSRQTTDTWSISGVAEQKISPVLKWTSVLSYNKSDNDIKRKITYDKSNEEITGNFDSWSFGGSSILEYDYKINNIISLKPSVGAVLDYIMQDSYGEDSTSGIQADSYSGFSAKAAANLKADITAFENNRHTFKLFPKIGYTYEMGTPYKDKTVIMTGFDGNIDIETREAERNNINLGLDLEYMYKDNFSIYAGYESGISDDEDRQEQITAGFKVKF